MGKKMRKKWFELIIYLVLFLLIGTGTELHSSALEAASVTDATESDADFSYGSYDVKHCSIAGGLYRRGWISEYTRAGKRLFYRNSRQRILFHLWKSMYYIF